MKHNLWIIDDEQGILTALQFALKKEYNVKTYSEPDVPVEQLKKGALCDLVLLDLRIKGENDGIEVLKKIKEINPNIVVIIMTAFSSIETTIEAMKQGAFTYLTKPLSLDELHIVIKKALEFKNLGEEVKYLSSKLDSASERNGLMVGESEGMKKVYDLIETVKDVDASILITGESGVGKELVAREIHMRGKRSSEHFVAVNCAAIPENMLEAEFFGSKRGSFTSSTKDIKGKFELADRGTLFLDEIGDMPLSLQGKILRVIQEKEFTPIGGYEPVKTDVRIIAATNRNLAKLIEEKKFREDLYYRLNVVTIDVPPLRERRDDIPVLCNFFREKYSIEMNKHIGSIDKEAMDVLMGYDYPGNVRQLANIIEYACIVNKYGNLSISNFPDYLSIKTQVERSQTTESIITEYFSTRTLKELEKRAIIATLNKNKGNRGKTASDLGISVRNLQNKIKDYGLNTDDLEKH